MRIWPPQQPHEPSDGGNDDKQPLNMRERIVKAISRVYDPEIPVNIYELGLIYRIAHDPESRSVVIDMTLTTPNCPEAEAIPNRVQREVQKLPEIDHAEVNLVWDPPWDKSRMSEDAKLILGID